MYCTTCGKNFEGGFCPYCGAPAQHPYVPNQQPYAPNQPPYAPMEQPYAPAQQTYAAGQQAYQQPYPYTNHPYQAPPPPPPPPVRQTNYVTMTSDRSKKTALLLCLLGLIGFAGFHRFYVGRIGSGILYLLTIGWFFFGTIIDLIQIGTDGFKDNAGAPLRQ